jgi:uncharacterized protein YecE (DUF72 family)
MRRVVVGTCGWAGLSQARYFETFRALEIQSTFYRLPRAATAARWRALAPPGFVFTMKASQVVTHPPHSPTYRRLGREIPAGERSRYGYFRPTDEVEAAWLGSEAVARALGAEVVVLQCPKWFRPTDENLVHLERFLERRRDLPFRLAFEPRGPWPADVVRRLCVRHAILHAVDPLLGPPAAPGPIYFRLHGPGGYASRHSDEQIEATYRRCAAEREAFVVFNNQTMIEDAVRFAHLLESRQRG